ncbi:Transposon Tf2-8 polyprotein [Trichinella sp. T6]|nr:Transposon Tf2-8 polyprotein [Trichinella sp. T6]
MEADTMAKVDQGRKFDARVVRELRRLFDIKKTLSSPYHPQGNGQAERFNRTLLDMQSIMCEENQKQWDEMLSFAMLAYNSSVNESTDADGVAAEERHGNAAELHPTNERAHWHVHEQMRRQLKVQQRRQKSLYDRKATQGTFRVKDLVWLAIPRRVKLHPCWEGPYGIVQTLGPHTHRVRHQERRRCTMVVRSDRIKKYVTREDADETRRRSFPLWYGSGNYPKEQQPKENDPGPRVEDRRSARTHQPPGY